jgi:hypothetical protein
MLHDEGPGSRADGGTGEAARSPEDRRRGRRRRLPFGRGAILESAVSNHVVAVVDLSVGGAYLATRAVVFPGQSLSLKLLLGGGGEIKLPCEVVRVCPRREGPDSYPPGVAVRFVEVEATVRERLAVFVEEKRRQARS